MISLQTMLYQCHKLAYMLQFRMELDTFDMFG
jgi:hypothetical protein